MKYLLTFLDATGIVSSSDRFLAPEAVMSSIVFRQRVSSKTPLYMAGTRPANFGLESAQLHFAVSILALRTGVSQEKRYTIFSGELNEVRLAEGGTFQSIAHLGIEGPDTNLLAALRIDVFCADDWTFTPPQPWSYLAHINEVTEEGTITYWCVQKTRARSARLLRRRDMASI